MDSVCLINSLKYNTFSLANHNMLMNVQGFSFRFKVKLGYDLSPFVFILLFHSYTCIFARSITDNRKHKVVIKMNE